MTVWKKAPRLLLLLCLSIPLFLHAQSPSRTSTAYSPRFDDDRFGARPGIFTIVAGLAFPVGRFSASDGASPGFAELGYSIGMEYNHALGEQISWISSISYTRNRTDGRALAASVGLPSDQKVVSRSWNTFWVLSGLQWNSPLTARLSLFISLQGGILIAARPFVTAGENNEVTIQNAESATDFAYRLSVGLLTSTGVCLAVLYESGRLSYDSASPPFQVPSIQTISVIQITAGFSL
jgi:hypothetical protein